MTYEGGCILIYESEGDRKPENYYYDHWHAKYFYDPVAIVYFRTREYYRNDYKNMGRWFWPRWEPNGEKHGYDTTLVYDGKPDFLRGLQKEGLSLGEAMEKHGLIGEKSAD